MKTNRLSPLLVPGLFAILGFSHVATSAGAEGLSREEIQEHQEKLAKLKDIIEGRVSDLNANAADAFLKASQDADAAVNLYFKCHWAVNFEREGRDEREFDDWKDSQRDRVKDPRFLQGLMLQLQYLAMTAKATEVEDISVVFPSLLNYSDGLMQLTELPSSALLSDVSGSIFAKAYKIEKKLRSNPDWELVPFNISGIYEKTVFPYLRANQPEKLMDAWDRRISQQTRMVEFFEAMENRGNRREERRQSEGEVRQLQGGRSGGIVRAHDKENFVRMTLPELRLGRLIDMFQYTNAAEGAAGMVAFVEENLEHEKASDWLAKVSDVLAAGVSSSESEFSPDPNPIPSPPVTQAPPAATTATEKPAGTPATTSGKVPPGLVPAN